MFKKILREIKLASKARKHIVNYKVDQRVFYLGNGLSAVRTNWDGYVVVPTYNVDVTIGILRDGTHEPWTTRLLQELLQKNQTYINVGANFGYYTCLGARIVGSNGQVISIEANPHVFCILMKTIMYGGIVDRVKAYNRAAYKTTGESLEFLFDYQYIGGGHIKHPSEKNIISTNNPFWNSESLPLLLNQDGKWVQNGLYNTFDVKTLKLDDITQEITADLIHCDVEQAEPYVILGAVDLIRKSPSCKIIFEWSSYAFQHGDDGYKAAVMAMLNIFKQEGYRIRRLLPILHSDGAIEVSSILSTVDFLAGEHGDYVALKAADDPWL